MNDNFMLDKYLYLIDCLDYDEYLDTLIKNNDLKFSNNIEFARDVAKLGYSTTAEVLTPQTFEQKKYDAKESINPTKKSMVYFSDNLKITDPVLIELQSREKLNTIKILSTIIFVVLKLKSGFEISAYIDFEQSLRDANRKTDYCLDWSGIFRSSKLIKPKPTDLSYFNWKKNEVISNNSDNYNVVFHPKYGLCFLYKGDHKLICLNPAIKSLRENSIRSTFYSQRLGTVVFYDHLIRRKV